MKNENPMKSMFLLCATAAIAGTTAAHANPIRVLILSGQNVHEWKATTPFLEKMYDDSKTFKVVETINDVSKITADTFAKCDVIVSNWTCHPQMTGGPWTEEGKKAFGDAIRSGKGMVSFHAACSACNDWEDFQEISGLTWKWEQTNHTQYHTFKVLIRDRSHPITQDMPDFWITDELYQQMVKMGKTDYHLLASAWAEEQFGGVSKTQPMLITTQLGKGRGVNLLLGHDVRAMSNPAFQTIMFRGTEWAATGKVTIPIPEDWPNCAPAAAMVGVETDPAIQAATTYAYGQARTPLYTVEQLVATAHSRTGKNAAANRAKLAAKLATAISECKTPEAKAFFCKEIADIGTPDQVPAVAPLLLDEQTNTMARFALERIPGPAAAKALRDALPNAKGNVKIGVVNSLGNKADPDAVAVLEPLLKDSDTVLAEAATAAIGKIGTPQAAKLLSAMHQHATDQTRPAVTDACLACAERLLAGGDKANAAGMYKTLYRPSEPGQTRAAALHGLVLVDPDSAAALLKEALLGNAPELHAMVALILRPQPGTSEAAPKLNAVALLSDVLSQAKSPEQKRPVLKLLSGQSAPAALQLAVSCVKDPAVADDAGLTAVCIAKTLIEPQRDAVRQAMKQVIAACPSPELRSDARNVLRRASRPANLAREAQASSPDNIDSDGESGGDAAAIDGNHATYWDEGDGQKLYVLKLTWQKPITCNAIVIQGYAFEVFSPRDFAVVCDDKVVKQVTNAVYDREYVECFVELPRTTCSNLELRITGYYGGSPGIRELEVYDMPTEDGASPSAAAPEYKWKKGDASVALLNHDKPVWQFNYARDNGYPYFSPVNLPDGTELVWFSPPDHVHHRALWFAWKMLNGVNYWEHVPDGGVTEVTDAKVETNPDFSARVELSLSYHPKDQPPVLTEKRIITVTPPAADGSYKIDWSAVCTAGPADIEMKGGTYGGGYAGLGARITKDAGEWLFINSEGVRVDQPPADGFPKGMHGQHARWSDFSFVSKATGSTAGLAILEHPSSLRYPSQWHDWMDANLPAVYLSPAPLWSEPYKLAANKEITLRYRILVHPGRPDATGMEKEFKAFSEAK